AAYAYFPGKCRVDGDIGAGACFGAVIVRTGKAVADANVVLTQEAEGFRGVEVQAVVVAGGVLEVAKALAQILTAQFRTRSRLSRSRVVEARRRRDRTTNQAARRP